MSADDDAREARLTDESIELMRRRIGFPNPTLRAALDTGPWNRSASEDSIRHWAMCIGDDNPLYVDPDYAAAARWGGLVAPPGHEMSMGWDRSPIMEPEAERATRAALRGIHLFNSGAEHFYHRPVRPGDTLYRAEWVDSVEEKTSQFASRSALVTNAHQFWNQNEEVAISGSKWFIHTERRKASKSEGKYAKDEPAFYTDAQLHEIEAAYDNQFLRGKDTLYLEDCQVGQVLPTMVKGPLTITDMINLHMGAGWLNYGNWPYRLAYEGRKRLRGFYTKNEFNAYDTLQRIHWDAAEARRIGVQNTYDIGPMRYSMLAHYLTNFAGDDGWVYYARSEYRNFNYMGDATWISAVITDVRVDEKVGPMIALDVTGLNQRGGTNLNGKGIILVSSRERGPVKLPEAPAITPHRR